MKIPFGTKKKRRSLKMSKKILYYYWGELNYKSAREAFEKLGYEVFVEKKQKTKFDEDEELLLTLQKDIDSFKPDFIFSFNYLPDLSRAAKKNQISYVCHCFDARPLTLRSITLANDCNKVFLFDYADFEELRSQGFNTVYYMPLSTNIEWGKWNKFEYSSDITFLGTLYTDDYDFLSQVKYMPKFLRGYLDAAMEAQLKVYGCDFIEALLKKEICDELSKYIKAELSNYYRDSRDYILKTMVYKETTIKERYRLLKRLGEIYKVDLYSPKKAPSDVNVNYRGFADYNKEMPHIFSSSKINLNITLRSIRSGMPLRIIDILGSKGFCLTNFQMELMEFFENDVNISWFESEDELIEKAGYYLKHDKEREKVATAGYETACKAFTSEAIYGKMFELI